MSEEFWFLSEEIRRSSEKKHFVFFAYVLYEFLSTEKKA